MERTAFAFSRTGGFSLIELIISLVILSLVLAFALPSFGRVIASNRASSGANEILRGLSLARQNALQTGAKVIFQPDTGGWAAGWQVARLDANPSDGQLEETLLAQSQFVPDTIEITACDSTTQSDGVTFSALGRPEGPIVERKLVIQPRPHANDVALMVSIAPSGAARVVSGADCMASS